MSRAGDGVARAVEVAVALAFIAAVLLNFGNVILRYGFGATIAGADEVQIYVMAAMTFIGAGIVAWRDQHLRMGVLAERLPERWRDVVRWLERIVAALVAGLLVYVAWQYVSTVYRLGMTSDAAGIPIWIPHSVVLVGFALVLLSYLLRRPMAGAEEKPLVRAGE